MKTTVLTLAFLIVCIPAIAVGKATTDPNAPGVAVQQLAEIDGADARLAKKVTISETRKTVSTILDDLSRLTGVALKAGYNSSDWQVRDRKMCVFAKDVPLVQIMNSISHVMKFKWDRKGENGKWQYRLFMDRRSLLDADSQKLREDERIRAKAFDKRKALLDSYANVEQYSKDDLAKLRQTDPLSYMYATTGIAGSLSKMFREVPALSDAVASGDAITLAGVEMPPAGRAGVASLVTSVLNFVAKLKPDHADQIANAKIDPATVTVNINRDLQTQTGGTPQYLLLAMIDVRFSAERNDRINLPLMNPDSAIGHALGNVLLKVAEGQIKAEDINKGLGEEIKTAAVQDMQSVKVDYGEPEIKHDADEPALKVKMKLEPEGKRLADIQKSIAQASSYAVISDSFGKTEDTIGLFDFTKQEAELGVILGSLCKAVLYNWDKQASVIEFRDREWFRKRSAQIPEATIESWRQTLTKTGTLDLPELAEIAKLEQIQYVMNVSDDEVLSKADISSVIWMNRDMLRLYAALTGNQRSAAMSDAGLDIGLLSSEQFGAAEDLLNTRNAGYLRDPNGRITLKITRKPNNKQYDCTMTVSTTTKDLPAITSKFTTPKIVEPPKEPEKASDKPASGADGKPAAQPAK